MIGRSGYPLFNMESLMRDHLSPMPVGCDQAFALCVSSPWMLVCALGPVPLGGDQGFSVCVSSCWMLHLGQRHAFKA